MDRIAADRKVDFSRRFFQFALDEGNIGFLDCASPKGFRQPGVSKIILGDDDDAGRFFVQAMHDARTELVICIRPASREVLPTSQKRVD